MKIRFVAAIGAAVLLLSSCATEAGSGSAASTAVDAFGSSTSSASSAPATTSADVDEPAESSEAPVDPAGACSYLEGEAAAKPVEPPPGAPTQTGEVPMTIATSIGDLSGTLKADTAPCTVNSFASLAEQGYFDDTECHRLTTSGIFVLQCGDPSASGRGGPGYSFADELSGSETYPAGTLAMANAGPDTNGSQFFVVYADTQLPPSYTVFGSIDTAAVALVQKLASGGTATGAGDGAPLTPVIISGVTVN